MRKSHATEETPCDRALALEANLLDGKFGVRQLVANRLRSFPRDSGRLAGAACFWRSVRASGAVASKVDAIGRRELRITGTHAYLQK
jgi:hypothetical protein